MGSQYRCRELYRQLFSNSVGSVIAQALAYFEQGFTLYRSPQVPQSSFRFDLGVECLITSVLDLWVLGYPEQAVQKSQAALDLADALDSPDNHAIVLSYTTRLYQFRRDWQETLRFAEAALAIAQERGISLWIHLCTMFRGWALAAQGQHDEGIAQLEQGLTAYRDSGARGRLPHFLALLAESQGRAGRVQAAREALEEALALIEGPAEPWIKAELYRLKGEHLRQQSPDHDTEAETCFYRALSFARDQEAKSWELHTATSLARLWQSQGKREEARELLAPVYGWFTEGFDTADLIDAKALLDELAG